MDNPALTSLPAWSALVEHYQQNCHIHLNDLFALDPERPAVFSLSNNDLTIDFSRQHITEDTLGLLITLAEQRDLRQAVEGLFTGTKLNQSESRPVLHTALRRPASEPFKLEGVMISEQVHRELDRVGDFVDRLHAGEFTGPTGKTIDTLVNIGIGGSDLGPRMACHALARFNSPITVHFVANIDAGDITSVLNEIDYATTLFVLSSKSCTTKETLTNANTVLQWLREHGSKQPEDQFVAVTANRSAAKNLGIPDERIFTFWEWVGGRYSLWSAIGLPLAVAIGMDQFRDLLAGAHSMDQHFRTQPFRQNMPVVLALLDIWAMNFQQAECTAIVPYNESLSLLPDYLSQLFMESNGKRVTQENELVTYQTSPIILGGTGTNSQHAFFQLLHQGTRLIPVEFLVVLKDDLGKPEHHKQLIANCLAQAEALMHGVSNAQEQPYRHLPGNKPSTMVALDELNPTSLGMLLALYEHRVFVQGQIWGINSFDQWGVELGKTIAASINSALDGDVSPDHHDATTQYWIERYRTENDS